MPDSPYDYLREPILFYGDKAKMKPLSIPENMWTIEKVLTLLTEYHENLCRNDKGKTNFNLRYIRSIDPALESVIYNKHVGICSLKSAFELAGINPYCHLVGIRYGREDDEYERKAKFMQLLRHIASTYGTDRLSDRSMNCKDSFLPPFGQSDDKTYPLCDALGCTLIPITFRSVYAERRRLFGDWPSALEAAGYPYNAIRRKKPKYDRNAVMRDLLEFDKLSNARWSIQDLRDQNHSFYRGIYNSHGDSLFRFVNWLPMPTAYLELEYLKRKTDGLDFTPEQFFNMEGPNIRQLFETEVRAQQSWSKARRRLEVLRRFASGARLNREAMGSSENRDDRTLLAALRRHHGGDYKKALRECGVDLDQLARVYRDVDDPFPRGRVDSEIKNLLVQSIETGELRLSRKYVSTFHPELEQAAIRHFKSWRNALMRVGLVPSVFELSASERTRKGLQFQEYIREFLIENGFNQVDGYQQIASQFDFVFNKVVPACKHGIKCRPDNPAK